MAGTQTANGQATGRRLVAPALDWWWPVCRSRELRAKPVAVTFWDRPIAVFRDAAGAPKALLDRCPHRNVALSGGRVHTDGCLECPYHGWRFDGQGACVAVPGLLKGAAASGPTRDVESHAACEQDGFVWIWGRPGEEPTRTPFPLPRVGGREAEVVFSTDLNATLHSALENTLDVPHTAFAHRGLFRGAREKELTAVRRDLDDGVEIEFRGEPAGIGPFQGGPLKGKVFEHWDRFFLPGIAQVEYRIEDWFRLYNTVLHLPVDATTTRAWFVVRWRSPIPRLIGRPIVAVQGRFVLRQDERLLRQQTRQVARFGSERFTSTDLDLLGAAIWRLLRRAAKVAGAEDEPTDGDATITFTA